MTKMRTTPATQCSNRAQRRYQRQHSLLTQLTKKIASNIKPENLMDKIVDLYKIIHTQTDEMDA